MKASVKGGQITGQESEVAAKERTGKSRKVAGKLQKAHML